MKEQKHIIHKVNVEVDVPDVTMARRLYSNLGDYLNSTVLPAVEAEFDRVIAADKYVRTESLTIDVFLDTEDQLETSLAPLVSKDLNTQLEKLLAAEHLFNTGSDSNVLKKVENLDRGLDQKSVTEKRWEIFIEFLKTGKLPWFTGSETWLDEETLMSDMNALNGRGIEILKTVLAENESAMRRLVKQFSSRFVLRLIEAQFSPNISSPLQKVKDLLLDTRMERKREIEQDVILKLLTIISSHDTAEQTIEKQLEECEDILRVAASDTVDDAQTRQRNQISKEERPGVKKKPFTLFEDEGIYVQNAGLILLHPFLQYFFMQFDLVKENEFKDEAARETAVHLLHYLGSGKQQPFEYNLLFEKYLCSFPLDEPVERFVTLSDRMKEESNSLLKAAIHHWKALKNTSIGGLQEGFLQRSGKLVLNAHQHRLIVETNTIDILLDQLPWGYSIVQLPWMEQILYVDWITS